MPNPLEQNLGHLYPQVLQEYKQSFWGGSGSSCSNVFNQLVFLVIVPIGSSTMKQDALFMD
jgi:hypothetical protein